MSIFWLDTLFWRLGRNKFIERAKNILLNWNHYFWSRYDPNSVGCVDPKLRKKLGPQTAKNLGSEVAKKFKSVADLRFAKLFADRPPSAICLFRGLEISQIVWMPFMGA